ncbi:MAG TPA: YicC family protein [bacterium]|nr:YicC family protein [bacterium]
MFKSMSGYAYCSGETDIGLLEISIKAYNNKYCDISIKSPNFLNEIEQELIALIREKLKRGKIYVNLLFSEYKINTIAVNSNVLIQYINELKKINELMRAEKSLFSNSIDLTNLLRLPEVINQNYQNKIEIEKIKMQVTTLLLKTLDALDNMRIKEADNLLSSIQNYINEIKQNIEIIKQELPKALINYKEKLHKIINECRQDLQSDNLEKKIMCELSLFADKIDVSEELERLKSHLLQFEKLLNKKDDEPIGKTLEFLVQEIQREINTCSVKSMNAEISQRVVNIKNLLEKIKEQIMNIV